MDHIAEPDHLRAFFRTGHRRQYQKNEMILRAGNEPEGVYLIETGLVKVFVCDKRGVEHITHFFGVGDFFPIIWLFRAHVRNVNYEVLEPTILWVIPRGKLLEQVNSNKDITFEMLEEMVDRYLRYSGRIENLLYTDARERTAYRLMSLASRFGKVLEDKRLVINASITQEDMARSLNMTRETFSRCLSRLQQRHIISYDNDRHVIIENMNALIKIIGREETEAMWPELMKFIID